LGLRERNGRATMKASVKMKDGHSLKCGGISLAQRNFLRRSLSEANKPSDDNRQTSPARHRASRQGPFQSCRKGRY